MAAACASRALWAVLTRPPNPARAPAAPRAAPRARAAPPSDGGDAGGGGRDNRRRRRPRAHGPHAPDVNLHWRAKNLERAGDRLGALRLLTTALELYPTNAHIGVSAARLFAENVDGRGVSTALDDALAIAERCAEHDPNNAVVANLRATLEARRGGKGAAARARALFARSARRRASSWTPRTPPPTTRGPSSSDRRAGSPSRGDCSASAASRTRRAPPPRRRGRCSRWTRETSRRRGGCSRTR